MAFLFNTFLLVLISSVTDFIFSLGHFQILTFVLMKAVYNYARSCVMYIMDDGGSGLMWGGCSMHVGAGIGALIGFVLTTVLKVFESEPPCPGM